jgi:hypothetical protein
MPDIAQQIEDCHREFKDMAAELGRTKYALAMAKEQAARWIPVKERLPNQSDAWCGEFILARHENFTLSLMVPYIEILDTNATHWMPIPPDPVVDAYADKMSRGKADCFKDKCRECGKPVDVKGAICPICGGE